MICHEVNRFTADYLFLGSPRKCGFHTHLNEGMINYIYSIVDLNGFGTVLYGRLCYYRKMSGVDDVRFIPVRRKKKNISRQLQFRFSSTFKMNIDILNKVHETFILNFLVLVQMFEIKA